MSNGIAFSDRQVEQLTELLYQQRTSTVAEIKDYVDQRFIEERQITTDMLEQRFAAQDEKIDQRLSDQEKSLRAFIQTELTAIRELMRKLDQRSNDDAKDTLQEIESLKQRIADLELKVKHLAAT